MDEIIRADTGAHWMVYEPGNVVCKRDVRQTEQVDVEFVKEL
jgi:hypothetical protein